MLRIKVNVKVNVWRAKETHAALTAAEGDEARAAQLADQLQLEQERLKWLEAQRKEVLRGDDAVAAVGAQHLRGPAVLSDASVPYRVAEAVGLIFSHLSRSKELRVPIGKAGAVEPLVGALWKPDAPAVEAALAALVNLCNGMDDHRDAAISLGVLDEIARLLAEHGAESEVSKNSAILLRSLVNNSEKHRAAFPTAGVVALVPHLDASTEKAVTNSAWCLSSLASCDAQHRDTIRQAGGLPRLAELLKLGADHPSTTAAAAALANLTHGNVENQQALCAAGALPDLLHIQLQGAETALGKSAAKARKALESLYASDVRKALQAVETEVENLQPKARHVVWSSVERAARRAAE